MTIAMYQCASCGARNDGCYSFTLRRITPKGARVSVYVCEKCYKGTSEQTKRQLIERVLSTPPPSAA